MAAQHYGDRLSRADDLLFSQLAATAEDLTLLQAHLEAQRADAENQRKQLSDARVQLINLLDKQRKLLAALDVIPVMGRAPLTPSQLIAWFTSLGFSYRLSGGLSIGTLIGIYYDEGNAEGVRPDMAFAQSILETGYFRSATDNNYAGLGACDTCAGEPEFPSPRDGIRAQIQHLKNYGDPDSRASGLAHPPQATWYGSDPAVAVRNFDTFFAKGHAQTWQAMGKGNWATDPNYSTKILSIYFRMVVYAADH
jgi:hypothetical protein